MNQGHSPSPTYPPAFSLLPRPLWGHGSLYPCPNWELLLWWSVLSPGQSLESPKRQPVRLSLITSTDVRRPLLTEGRTPPPGLHTMEQGGERWWAHSWLWMWPTAPSSCSPDFSMHLTWESEETFVSQGTFLRGSYHSCRRVTEMTHVIATKWLVSKVLWLACFHYVNQKTISELSRAPQLLFLATDYSDPQLFKVRAMAGSQEPSRSKLTSPRWSQRLLIPLSCHLLLMALGDSVDWTTSSQKRFFSPLHLDFSWR